LISVKNLTKQYDNIIAIKNISFELTRGTTMALLGPNGAGKTTIMKCLMGVIPFEGQVQILGLDSSKEGKAVRRKVGYLPQHNSLYENMSVMKNMKYWADIRGASRKSVEDALEIVGLDIYADFPVRKLSAGMKQRAMFAASLIGEPEVLLLDEPTSNLDVKWRIEFKKIIEFLKKGTAIMIASHLLKETQELCDNVLILDQGREVSKGAVNVLIEQLGLPDNLYISIKNSTVERASKFLQSIGYPSSVKEKWIILSCKRDEKLSILNALEEDGYKIIDFRVEQPTLEDIFFKVTSKGIGMRVRAYPKIG
jgi:ABC-type multidrug transport system ATPase subunit